MLFQKGERMEIKEYYAKPEQTIEEHVTKLLDELEILKNMDILQMGKSIIWSDRPVCITMMGRQILSFSYGLIVGRKYGLTRKKSCPIMFYLDF